MHIALTPDSPLAALSPTAELLFFANKHQFICMRELIQPGIGNLHLMEGFGYRLQHQIVQLLAEHHWENLLVQ